MEDEFRWVGEETEGGYTVLTRRIHERRITLFRSNFLRTRCRLNTGLRGFVTRKMIKWKTLRFL